VKAILRKVSRESNYLRWSKTNTVVTRSQQATRQHKTRCVSFGMEYRVSLCSFRHGLLLKVASSRTTAQIRKSNTSA
jgi:hypothetical protein